MTRVNLDVTMWSNYDGEDSDEAYSYRGTTDGTVDRVYVSTRDYDYGYRGYETDLQPPFFVVYSEYYTGDTFGSDFEAAICGVFKTEEEAREFEEEARDFKGFGSLSNGYYVPWNGYFESLLDIKIERIS